MRIPARLGIGFVAGRAAAVAGDATGAVPPLSDAARTALIDDLGSASGLTRAQALQTLASDVCEDERTALIDAALERARTPAARLELLHRMVYVHGQKPSIPALA